MCFLGNMYGGVATPLALLHQGEGNGRSKQYNQLQTRATSSRDVESSNGSYSVGNAMPRVMPMNSSRLPPLRESNNRSNDMNHTGENEPLLPMHSTPKIHSVQRSHNGKKILLEQDLPPPPLPPHKNNNIQSASVQKLNADMKYTPPWPRGPAPTSLYSQSHKDDFQGIKPYLKPLPKPPGKESSSSPSPNHHHIKYTRQSSVPVTRQHQPSMLPPLPLRLDQLTPERTQEAAVRNKLKSNVHNPLYHLQRHYSDESLQGSSGHYGCSVPQRIHSSADEISSLNHSPSISSSDESYSRTTDADLSPSPSPPPHGDSSAKQWLFPSDIQVNPCSSPETSPRASLDYIPPQCYMPSSNGNGSANASQDSIPLPVSSSRSFSPASSRGNKHNGPSRREWNNIPLKANSNDRSKRNINKNESNNEALPPSTLLALAAGTNTLDSSLMSSPPLQDCDESYKGDSCTSFEFIGKQRNHKPPSLLRSCSNEKPASKIPLKQRSLDKNLFKMSVCENVLEANKLNITNSKRSPHLKELDEIQIGTEAENIPMKGSLHSDKSLKKDSSSQTDKKDMTESQALKVLSCNGNDKNGPTLVTAKLLNDVGGNTEGKVDQILLSKLSGPFEREIQKFLDEQNLLKNNPPKTEINHQTKDILSLDEMQNVAAERQKEPVVLARYACRSPVINYNNNSSPPLTHQVGLAAIQALARKQQDELNNLVESNESNNHQIGFRFNPVDQSMTLQAIPADNDKQRESSKESSLKRSRGTTPEDFETSKVQRVSSLPKDFPVSLNSPIAQRHISSYRYEIRY